MAISSFQPAVLLFSNPIVLTPSGNTNYLYAYNNSQTINSTIDGAAIFNLYPLSSNTTGTTFNGAVGSKTPLVTFNLYTNTTLP